MRTMMTKFTAFAVVLTMIAVGCKKKDNTIVPAVAAAAPIALKTTYNLKVKDMLGVSGTVSFAEKTAGGSQTIVTISLTGAPAGSHPAHIHMNSAIETGGIAYALNDVDSTGKSTTTLSVLYNTLINYDGYVNVHLDAATMNTIIAQGDIGGNFITGTNKIYSLVQDSSSGVSGIAKFETRKNGNTLVTVDLTSGGTLPSGFYPAHINLGSVATIGAPSNRRTLNNVDATTRMSITNIRTLNDGTAITYANWLVYDGFITIHDAADISNVIAKGNIGSN